MSLYFTNSFDLTLKKITERPKSYVAACSIAIPACSLQIQCIVANFPDPKKIKKAG